jgi:DIX domain
MSFCMVYYHIPEDFDDPEQPNAFGIGKNLEDVKLSDIKRLFPIEGTYMFRFKNVINKTTVWIDLNDDNSNAIPYQNKIIIKATRLSWKPSLSLQNRPSEPQTLPKPSQFNLFEFEPQKKLEQFDLLFPQ